MGYSEAGVKLIHEKNQKQKISWRCPLNYAKIILKNLTKNRVTVRYSITEWVMTWQYPYPTLNFPMIYHMYVYARLHVYTVLYNSMSVFGIIKSPSSVFIIILDLSDN